MIGTPKKDDKSAIQNKYISINSTMMASLLDYQYQ